MAQTHTTGERRGVYKSSNGEPDVQISSNTQQLADAPPRPCRYPHPIRVNIDVMISLILSRHSGTVPTRSHFSQEGKS